MKQDFLINSTSEVDIDKISEYIIAELKIKTFEKHCNIVVEFDGISKNPKVIGCMIEKLLLNYSTNRVVNEIIAKIKRKTYVEVFE